MLNKKKGSELNQDLHEPSYAHVQSSNENPYEQGPRPMQDTSSQQVFMGQQPLQIQTNIYLNNNASSSQSVLNSRQIQDMI